MSFLRYLEVLEEQERSENLLPSQVPATFLFAFAGTRIVGRVSVRHALNPYFERFGSYTQAQSSNCFAVPQAHRI